MNKEKQIEQMARTIDELLVEKPKETTKHAMNVATYLFDRGYRKQEWISVEDRLPEVRQRVLLYSYHDGINTGYRADEIGRFYVDKSYPYRPTHWMPLPEPPKMKGGAE